MSEGWEVFDFATKEGNTDLVGCMAGRSYPDGTRLSFVVTTSFSWAVGVANETWELAKGATTDVAALVDRKFVASGKAWHTDNKSALLPLDGLRPFRALQTGRRLQLQTPQGHLAFELSGSAKAMDAVLECVRTLPPPPGQQTKVLPEIQLLPQSEAAMMIVNLLNSAGIAGYRLITPMPGDVSVPFSLPDGTFGSFRAARGAGTPLADDFAGTVIRRYSDRCKDDFLSGRQSIPSVDGSVIRKVVTTCRDRAGGVWGTESTIVRRTTGFLIEVTHMYPAGVTGVGNDRERQALLNAALGLSEGR